MPPTCLRIFEVLECGARLLKRFVDCKVAIVHHKYIYHPFLAGLLTELVLEGRGIHEQWLRAPDTYDGFTHHWDGIGRVSSMYPLMKINFLIFKT